MSGVVNKLGSRSKILNRKIINHNAGTTFKDAVAKVKADNPKP